MKTVEELLEEKIPRDMVSLRDGGGGRKLSYLEGWYVIDRLNKIFGPQGWSKEITDVREVKNTTNKGEFPAYLVKVRLTVLFPSGLIVKEGYGYGSDKSTQNAHELAIKEAVTDALKVAAKDLGMSMGLALYDKTQENVDDGDVARVSKDAPKASKHQEEGPKNVATDDRAKGQTNEGGNSSEKIRAYIQSATKIAIKKGVSLDQIKKELSTKFSIASLADAQDTQLPEIKKYIDSLI